MDGITTALVAALCIGIVTLIVALISRFLGRFNAETRRIADNMRRAQDSDEYIYWQSRLRRHYIRLLPFVSEKTAGRICSRLFRKPKHCQEKEHSDGLFHILAPSVLSVCLCAICLCGMSWAWFTATGNTSVSTIQAATYDVTVSVSHVVKGENGETNTESEEVESDGDCYKVSVNDGVTYTVTITPKGSNTATAGYCEITYNNDTYYTEALTSGSLSFTVYNANDVTLTVTPKWGTRTAYGDDATIKGGDSIGGTPSDLSMTTDSLAMSLTMPDGDEIESNVAEAPGGTVKENSEAAEVEEEGTANESDQTQSSKEGENDEPENEAEESGGDDQAEQSNNNNSGGTQEPAASTSGSETTNGGTSENTSGNSTNTESGTSSDTGGTAAD